MRSRKTRLDKERVNAGLVDRMTMSGSAEELALDLAREIAQARNHVCNIKSASVVSPAVHRNLNVTKLSSSLCLKLTAFGCFILMTLHALFVLCCEDCMSKMCPCT